MSSRSASVGSVHPMDTMDDHRNQPDSLPVRTSFSELHRVPTDRTTLARGRTLSRSSCAAYSERSFVDDEEESRERGRERERDTGGILLNGPGPSERERRRSRRPTKSSIISGHSSVNEAGSTLSFADEQTEEDVCFPMVKAEGRTGVNFKELDEFSAESRLNYDPRRRMTYEHDYYCKDENSRRGKCSHRPLVPVSIDEGLVTPVNSLGARAAAAAASARGSTGVVVRSTGMPLSDSTQADSSGEDDDNLRVNSSIPDFKTPFTPTGNSTRDDIYSPRLAPKSEFKEKADSVLSLPLGDKGYLPDRFSFFASESDETIHAPDIPSLVHEGQSFQELFDNSSGMWWLDCYDPTDLEMKIISKAFSIHPLTTEDIRTEESREKVELFKSYYFVCFHTFNSDPDSDDFLEPINMYVVVFKDGILSFHFSPVQHTVNVRRRIRQLRDYVSVSSDWICYALIDDITDSFAPIIREISYEADEISETVFLSRDMDFAPMIRRISESRHKVMSLLRLLSGKADVIRMFAKRCNEQWDNAPKGEIGLYLGDIQDHIVTMHQNLTTYEKIFARSLGNYLAQLQVGIVTSNNKVTAILGKVTLLGTILVPMNLITGMFGMNVHVPGEGVENLRWFFSILGFIIFLALVLLFIAQWYLNKSNITPNNNSADDDSLYESKGVFKTLRRAPRKLFSSKRRGSISSRPSRVSQV